MLIRLSAAVLCVAHGALHLGFIAPPPADPDYPFSLEESWLVPAAIRRETGLTLATIAILAFAGLALVALGVPRLHYAWRPLLGFGAFSSLVLLLAYWNPWLIIGVALNLALIVATIADPDWWNRVVG